MARPGACGVVDLVRPRGGGGPAWQASPFDAAQGWMVLQGTWLFEDELDLERLKGGLEALLALYPHLSGRMAPGWVLDRAGTGVPFAVRDRTDLTVGSLTAVPAAPPGLALAPRPGRLKAGQDPVMTVTVSRLRDGTALSVCCAHVCLDGDGFYSMVGKWSALCRGEAVAPPVVDQSLHPRPARRAKAEVLREALAEGWRRIGPGTVARGALSFGLRRHLDRAPPLRLDAEAMARITARVREGSGLAHLGSNLVLSAHLTRQCMALHRLEPGRPGSQVTVVNGRERLSWLPRGFAGNGSFVVTAPDLPALAAPGALARAIAARLEPCLGRPAPTLERMVRLASEAIEHRLLLLPYDPLALVSERPTTTYINNFSKMPIYDVDFGADARPVRPVRAIPHNLGDQVLLWPAPPSASGVEVYLAGAAARAMRRLPPGDPWWATTGGET